MKIAIFSAHDYEKPFFITANHAQYQLHFFSESLQQNNAHLAQGFDVVCCFVTDKLNAAVIDQLKQVGVKLIALRSAGFDHVDLAAAKRQNLPVVRVPSYSPAAIAEFTIAMILALDRKLLQAHAKVQRHDFSLAGQIGFNLGHKTVGLIGTGQIGGHVAKLLLAFGCKVLAYDIAPNLQFQSIGVAYVDLATLYQQADIISLHCPLTPATKYMINENALQQMQPDVMLINTGRGGLIDTRALIAALEHNKVGCVGLDVYEHEAGLFFIDHSNEGIKDEVFLRLQTFPNVFITSHQAYLTEEALTNIARITFENITAFAKQQLQNQVVIR